MTQELNQALATASQDPACQPYCEEITMILAAREKGEISREEAEYLLREMAEVRIAQDTAVNEQYARWTVQALSLAAKLI